MVFWFVGDFNVLKIWISCGLVVSIIVIFSFCGGFGVFFYLSLCFGVFVVVVFFVGFLM